MVSQSVPWETCQCGTCGKNENWYSFASEQLPHCQWSEEQVTKQPNCQNHQNYLDYHGYYPQWAFGTGGQGGDERAKRASQSLWNWHLMKIGISIIIITSVIFMYCDGVCLDWAMCKSVTWSFMEVSLWLLSSTETNALCVLERKLWSQKPKESTEIAFGAKFYSVNACFFFTCSQFTSLRFCFALPAWSFCCRLWV